MSPKKKGILFVCMGNICRSPAGETVFKHLVKDKGLENRIHVDSAGTIDYHTGEMADRRMREAAATRGYQIESISRRFETTDFDRFDMIVAMDEDNAWDLKAQTRDEADEDKIHLLCDFLPNSNVTNVPDPYYGGPDGFEKVLDMIEEASVNILDFMLSDEMATESV